MSDAELDELLQDCPTLYHMAERGSWPAIQRLGLLSTSALLDRHGVTGETRRRIEVGRRAEAVRIESSAGSAVIRDQKPMDDASLRRCLTDGLAPEDWYRLLNGKVFFWLSQRRLLKLLGAKPYRTAEHDVLELDARALVTAYRSQVTLCAINSGFTLRFPQPRGLQTFASIADYPYAAWRQKRPRGERVVELAVTGGVPDAARFVTGVRRMRHGAQF